MTPNKANLDRGFTDEDLKRLKAEIQSTDQYEGNTYLDNIELYALLHRLEAAERFCNCIGKVSDLKNLDWVMEADQLFKDWLRSKGLPPSGDGEKA